jgi:glucokinase
MSVSIALDIGGTSIKLAIVRHGHILADDKIEVTDNARLAPLLPIIASRLSIMMSDAGVDLAKLKGVGAAFPCIIDFRQGRILSDFVKYTDANDLDLNRWAIDTWQVPLTMENDARAALVGEWQYGQGQGVDNLMQMTFGTGIGTAVLMDGHVLRGSHYLAGNLGGHVTIDLHGDVCSCGNIGCVEAVASTWALPAMLNRSKHAQKTKLSIGPDLNYKQVFDLADQGDELAIKIKKDSIYAWGIAMINLVHSFDPERVIVSGGVMGEGEDILSTFQMMLNKHTWLPSRGNVEVMMATHRNSAALLGMDYLVQNKNL